MDEGNTCDVTHTSYNLESLTWLHLWWLDSGALFYGVSPLELVSRGALRLSVALSCEGFARVRFALGTAVAQR